VTLRGEDRLIDWLRRHTPGTRIGDDAAVLPRDSFAVTTDTQIAGVHVPPNLDPGRVARRLLAVNASDLAAMGAEPAFAFLVIAAPDGFDHRRFLHHFVRAAQAIGAELAGGDLAHSRHLVVSATLLGRQRAGSRWLRRDGARPGHRVWLGGTVGEAHLGLGVLAQGAEVKRRGLRLPPPLAAPRTLAAAARRAVRRQLLPLPQLALGRWLACHSPAGAAIDLSDSLAHDLHRLCRASDTGAEIDARRLPVPRDAKRLAATLGIDLEEALWHGGEDYVLCFTLPAECVPPDEFQCIPIGRIRNQPGIERIDSSGTHSPVPDRGFDHLIATV